MAKSLLDPDALQRRAEGEIGSANWGPAFDTALTELCRSARDEARLSAQGEARLAAQLCSLLKTRLQLYADRARHPEISAQEIVAPLIVTGLPRSGTTILHGLLAQDPRARSPQRWEVERPSPPPRSETYSSDPRIAAMQARVDALPAAFKAMHAMGATLPEECNSVMQLAFASPNFGATMAIPSYMRWLLEEADMTPAFALHRDVLQSLQAFAPGVWWVLKSPPYLWWPDALLAAYPDARLIVTHRDPAEVMASNASLIAWLREQSGPVDRRFVGAEQTAQWELALDRFAAFRAAHGNDAKIVDCLYRELVRDPLALVGSIYDRFGVTLTTEARTAMERFMAENSQGKHGTHRYDPADFGLEPDVVRARFADYTARHAIPSGAA